MFYFIFPFFLKLSKSIFIFVFLFLLLFQSKESEALDPSFLFSSLIWMTILVIFLCSPLMNSNIFKGLLFLNAIFCALFFGAHSLFIFFLLYEMSIFPILFMISSWGYQIERLHSTYYMVLYTMFFSVPGLISFIFLMFFSWKQESSASPMLGAFLSLMFLVKLPSFFLHIWLPKAHVEAPTVGSIFLAATLLKLGGFGLLRVFPFFKGSIWKMLIFISIFGMIFSCFLCISQSDSKSLVAYSSVVHMNFMLLGISLSLWSSKEMSGTIMLYHGMVSSVLFFFMGSFFSFMKTRKFYFLFSSGSLQSASFLFILSAIFNFSPPITAGALPELFFCKGGFSISSSNLMMVTMFILLSGYFCIFMFLSFFNNKKSKFSVFFWSPSYLMSISLPLLWGATPFMLNFF